MKRILSVLFIVMAGMPLWVAAQGMLPDFSVKELTKGKIQVSWNNPYSDCIQLAVQRSADSSKNFRTIFSSQSPELATNGFVDNKPLNVSRAWYRIFFSLQGGAYYFSKSISVELKNNTPVPEKNTVPAPSTVPPSVMADNAVPLKELTAIYFEKKILFRLSKKEYLHFRDSINTKTKDKLHRINERAVEWMPSSIPSNRETIDVFLKDSLVASVNRKNWTYFKDSVKTFTKDTLVTLTAGRVQLRPYIAPAKKYVFIYRNDSLVTALEMQQYRKFKDSIATKTKDTLYANDNQHIEIRSYVPKFVWKPSAFVFTNAKGYVTIRLPESRQHRYSIVFLEEDGTELFRIKSLKEPELILDKTDFIHAGWFYFELYEDEKLKEKNKFMLTRE